MERQHCYLLRRVVLLVCLLAGSIGIGAQTFVSSIESGRVYRITNKSQSTVALVDYGGTNLMGATGWTNNTYNSLWTVTANGDGDGYTVENLETGRYMQGVNGDGVQATMSDTEQICYIPTTGTDTYFNILPSADGAYSLNLYGGGETSPIKGWNKGVNGSNDGSIWQFTEVPLSEAELAALEAFRTGFLKKIYRNHGLVRIVSSKPGYTSNVIYENEANEMRPRDKAASTADKANWDEVWIVARGSGTWSLRNLKSGRYAKNKSDHTVLLTTTDRTPVYIRNSNVTEDAFNIAFDSGYGWNCLNNALTTGIIRWTSENDNGCDWTFESVEDISYDQVKEHLQIPTYVAPQNGKYYKIVNYAYGDVMTAIAGSNYFDGQDYAEQPSQWWKVAVSGTSHTFQNAGTGKYIQSDPGSGSSFSLGTSAASFQLDGPTDEHYGIYATSDNGGRGLHQSVSQSDKIVSWSYTADASRWYFEEVTLSDEEIEAKVAAYQEYMNATDDAPELSATYLAFFTDASATTLKSEYQAMSDDELRSAMSTLPALLQNEALKVKNNSWDAWEKEFRVADYNIFSDANDWSGYLQVMAWGVMNNPTGVVAQNGEVVYVVVGDDIPANTTLTLEARKYYDVGNDATQSITLQKGLNALPVANDGSHIYVRYETDFGTVTKDNKASRPDIATYPSLNIHVIGGQVHGYVDKAKHTDSDWVGMRQNGLFWAEQTDLLGECSQVRLQTDFATANGNQIIRLIDMYDWYVGTELDVMGVTAVPEEYKDLPDAGLAYEDIYPKKVNNRLLCISKKDEGGNPYGSSYHIYVPGSGNYLYDNLKNKDGGSIWVFGHEWGHVNQGPINIAASNEASNNLYPNILANRGGYSTSRGWNVQELQRKMANERNVKATGTYESQFGVTNDNYVEKCGEYSWPRTVLSWDNIGKHFTPAQMFYQLYLYYHAAGHNPLFYPRLFNELRKDPLRQGADGNKITGWSDYLHFAMKACDAAGENLEDFFEAWGFFVPVDNYFVECYSQWYITTTQDHIDDALDYMRNYSKANESIIFIDDRATVSYQADGVTPKVPFDSDNVENCKTDFAGAQYSAFNGEASRPEGLAYTTSTNAAGNTVVTINTDVTGVTNAAGVKFYDEEGKLVYFASQTEIEIPSTLPRAVDYSKTVISLTDGTTMPLYEEDATGVFLQTIHHGDGTTSTRYTKGGDGAILDPDRDGKNAIALIAVEEGTTVDNAIAETPNVAVNNVLHTISLTDKVDYSVGSGNARNAVSLSAKNIEYKNRNLYQGWNTICLPFAITVADFGEGAKLEVLGEVKVDEDGDVLCFQSVNEVAAGQPCLLYVPEGNASWAYEKTNDEAVAVATTAQVTEGNFYMNGGFVNKNIGAGHYKLVQTGDAFAKTTSAAVTFPFRAYISVGTGAEGASLVRAFHFSEDTETGITAPSATEQGNRICYDLQGRKVEAPQRGVVYILGGKKVMFK